MAEQINGNDASKSETDTTASISIPPSSGADTETQQTIPQDDTQPVEHIFTFTVKLPQEPGEVTIQVSTQEQVQDVRQSIVDQPQAMQYTCFHLDHNGERVNDFIELSEVPGISAESILTVVEDPYNEKEARMHVMRIRELIGAAGDRTDTIHGIEAGLSLHDSVTGTMAIPNGAGNNNGNIITNGHSDHPNRDLSDYKFDAPGTISSLLPPVQTPPPKTIKSISLSPWNPPPFHLRTRGHLLYLVLVTNEGEQYHITSHVSGFFVNKSSHNKFDPFPKPGPKNVAAHSLLVLIRKLSPSFEHSFQLLLEHSSKREPLAMFQLSNAIPASPWLVPSPLIGTSDHQADITRTQENYLMAGAEGTDTLRDWNEEFQSTRELPKDTVQDKVFRERLTSKLFADYNEAATRGAVLVARGEIPPLNPTEGKDAQIFVYNNVFLSFGADGVGTFATDGGDEAARVATGKDVMGVKAVNQLDIAGLFTPGTVVVDYLGKRIVCQSIVPGIFKQREPGEHQIDYGGVEGKDVVADNEAFQSVFQKLSGALHVKKHTVWDKEGKQHVLEGSVETKGLIGTDSRKYVLDLYRITPLDVDWIEQHWSATEDESADSDRKDYPHRMAVLRPELISAYAREKLREYAREQASQILSKPKQGQEETTMEERSLESGNGEEYQERSADHDGGIDKSNIDRTDEKKSEIKLEDVDQQSEEHTRVDVSGFSFTLNPDVFSGQKPQSDEEKEQMETDEADVRAVCTYLTAHAIPYLLNELREGDVGFPMDGESLSTLLHKRGINIRYLGMIATLSATESPRLQALKRLAMQEMVSRAYKHVISRQLKSVPPAIAPSCIAHTLNCLLGRRFNSKPTADVDSILKTVYPEADLSFEEATPDNLRADILEQIRVRYRYTTDDDLVEPGKEIQMLREISLKLGVQLVAKDYQFSRAYEQSNGSDEANGIALAAASGDVDHHINGGGKRKKKSKDGSPQRTDSPCVAKTPNTFQSEDVLNFVPIVKEASPKSALAEEAYDGGRLSLAQDQKELGQELLLESLSLYEQIYGILHPEVAKTYLQLSTLYYSMDEKNAAVELARKAVIVAERTMGIDASDTILAYLNLGLFEHANGNSAIALPYVLHALELWKIVYGPNHPDSMTTINNAAVMLQSMKRYHESRIWFEASLAIAEEVAGKQSVSTATLLFQLAQALALDRDTHAAVNRMREACNIFRSTLGAEDRNTKDAEQWLDQLTQSAVSLAKREKDIKSGKVRRVHFTNRVPMGARPQLQAGQSSADAARGSTSSSSNFELDNRNIDELIKYIDGDAANKKASSSKKRSSGNPKRRTAGITA